MITTGQKVTLASVVGGILAGAGFVWSQWSQVRPFVEEKPIVAVLAVAGLVLAATFGITRSVLHRRHMSSRVRRGRG
jgi:hypothetical protein